MTAIHSHSMASVVSKVMLSTGIRSGGSILCLLTAASVFSLTHETFGQAHPVAPRGEFHQMVIDSGQRQNLTNRNAIVFADVIHFQGAAWTRLHFSELNLDGSSIIRCTSLLDGDVQEMNAVEAAMWSYSSAYFNGDAVLVELIAAPDTVANSLVLEGVEVEMIDIPTDNHCTPPLCGICFGSDDRVPSDEDFAGRIMPNGCSGIVYNTDSCILTAGHCNVSTSSVIQFRVPDSTAGCALQHPSSLHQFPVTAILSSAPPHNPGSDWAVATTGTSFGGLTIYERYGEFRPLADSVPTSGSVDIWGFGVSETCTLTQTQQHSTGPITGTSSTQLHHRADATCGNSGSGVLFNDEIISITTHCAQNCPSGSNTGTRIDINALQNAIDELCPAAPAEPPENNTCPNRIVVGDGTTSFTNVDATTTGPDEPEECDLPIGDTQIKNDVWYEYTASCTGEMTVSLCTAGFPTKLGVYAGSSCPTQPGTIAACDIVSCPTNTFPEIIMPVNEGETFILRIGGRTNEMGSGTFNITCEATAEPDCPADLNDDGVVNVLDLLILLEDWGSCPGGCPADLNDDEQVNVLDLLILLEDWGDCP